MPDIKVLNELTIKKNGVSTTYKLGTVNGYYNSADGKFYEDSAHTTEIEGAPNLVYADIAGNALYIYKTATSSFVKVSGSGGSADNLKFGYLNDEDGKFYEDDQYQVEIPGNADYLFIGLDNDTIYRYDTTNTAFVSIDGGGDGTEYQAGTGIDITDDVISGDYKGGFNIKIDGDEISTKTFVGTQAEWDNLTSAQKAKFDVVSITDDSTTLNNTPGHGIVDSTGTDMPQRSKLQFADATITDDATNDVTIVTHDPYTAGDKIDITNREISCDETVKGTFIGTKAEWDALSAADKAKYDIVNLTDDEITPAAVVDTVVDGNMNPVTSNAVYDAINGVKVNYSNNGAALVKKTLRIERYVLEYVTLETTPTNLTSTFNLPKATTAAAIIPMSRRYNNELIITVDNATGDVYGKLETASNNYYGYVTYVYLD